MLKKPGIILLALGISTLLSSCLVNQKDVETSARTTDKLRIYQAGDYIEYAITAVVNTGTSTTVSQGILRVQWDENADLPDPHDNNIKYSVLKETTELTYEEGSSETNATVVRYISQSTYEGTNETTDKSTKGTITLYAIDGGTADYWLYDPDNVGTPSSNIILPIIFDSPMKIGMAPPNTSLSSPIDFSVMEDCDSGVCGTEIYNFNDSFNIVGDTTSITTNLATFSNPFEITFSGGAQSKNAPNIEFLGDIRNACGTSAHTINHSGNMFVMPSIGIVQMNNFCQNILTGNNVNYIMTLNNTNIPLP